jgi:hypothetical protein
MLQLQCCGIEGPKDWDRNNYFNCSSRDVGSREACGVPFSCCKRKPNVSMYRALDCGALCKITCVSLDTAAFFVYPSYPETQRTLLRDANSVWNFQFS